MNNIDKGTDQFYIQMIVDSVDAGKGDYNMAGVYADDTPPQGNAPRKARRHIIDLMVLCLPVMPIFNVPMLE